MPSFSYFMFSRSACCSLFIFMFLCGCTFSQVYVEEQNTLRSKFLILIIFYVASIMEQQLRHIDKPKLFPWTNVPSLSSILSNLSGGKVTWQLLQPCILPSSFYSLISLLCEFCFLRIPGFLHLPNLML